VVSNAAFLGELSSSVCEARPVCRVIGHLSVLFPAKGVFEVVELAEWAEREKLPFEFLVAGPFVDDEVRREFDARTQRLRNLRYLGPIYGEQKKKFFEELDAFVLPTQFRYEAEPVVLYEALSHGCPVISYDRGCISAIIDSACGTLVPRQEAFLPIASATLRSWQADPNMHRNRRLAARNRFATMIHESLIAKQRLLDVLRGGRVESRKAAAT
jgi:glycosyltransferase involved in cell wall biosynthesis